MVIDIDEIFIPMQLTHTASRRSDAVVPINRENVRPSAPVLIEGARNAACQTKETNSAADKGRAAIASFFAGGCI